MDLEDKVVSLELSKILLELGVKQQSSFYWVMCLNTNKYILVYNELLIKEHGKLYEYAYSAFTSDELMDLLPCFVDTKKNEPFNNFWLEVQKRRAKNIQYSVNYISDSHAIDKYGNLSTVKFGNRNIYDEKLADALAKMLIYLLEENLYVRLSPIDISE